eukprot:SAG31_NODE_3823_length_3849_cov_2.562133_6_plen_107_part_00
MSRILPKVLLMLLAPSLASCRAGTDRSAPCSAFSEADATTIAGQINQLCCNGGTGFGGGHRMLQTCSLSSCSVVRCPAPHRSFHACWLYERHCTPDIRTNVPGCVP